MNKILKTLSVYMLVIALLVMTLPVYADGEAESVVPLNTDEITPVSDEADEPAAPFAGSGTEDEPYLISTAEDLVTLEELTNVASSDANAVYAAKYYKLTNDIDMSGVTFNGICKSEKENGDWFASVGFSGTIDGDGHIIENMTIARTTTGSNAANIFGALVSRPAAGCTVKKLGLVNASVSAYQSAAGFIGGRFGGSVTLEDCFIKTITLSTTVAGAVNSRKQSAPFITCTVAGSTIKNCYSLDVTGTTEGCAQGDYGSGSYKQSTAQNCYSTNKFLAGRGITHTNGLQSIANAAPEDIAAFIAASGGAFVADVNNTNGGYPLLKWETQRISDSGVVIIADFTAQADGTYEFVIKNCNTGSLDAAAAVVFYGENDMMLGAMVYGDTSLESGDTLEDNTSISDIAGAVCARLFLWNTLSGQELNDCLEYEILSE